jgi:preprotein translocase subunit SecY
MPEFRKKIFYTLAIIVVFRFGSIVPVPFLNPAALKMLMGGFTENTAFNMFDNFSGGAFSQGTLFAMSVSPYINASIVMQLMTVVIPALERLSREGEEGRKKVGAITRYLTVVLGIIQASGYYFFFLRRESSYLTPALYMNGFEGIFSGVAIIATFTAGVAMMMWLGEQVNKNGMGNGMSILLFAGIVSKMPETITKLVKTGIYAYEHLDKSWMDFIWIGVFVLLFLFLVWIIVYMNDAERRIPVQYAKQISGRKMYGGQSSHLPVKVGLAGVMPVIFASTLLSVPGVIALFIPPEKGTWFAGLMDAISPSGWIYAILQFIFILFFAYFYVSIQYNPIEISNNLRQSNGTIPGIRPGKPTSDFISRIFSKITLIGALFLSVISFLPMLFGKVSNLNNIPLAGTSIIILVGVAIETVKQMDSQIMQKHYKGFLD